jgi:hypothetical protein
VILNLTTSDVNLQSIVDGDVGVRVTNGTTIVSGAEWDALGAELNTLNFAQLIASLLGFNAMESETALHIVQETEMLVGALNGDDIHEASREGGVSAHLSINANNALVKDQSHLAASESVFETITEQDNKRQALTEFVRTSRRARSKDAAHLVEHPVRRSVDTLEVLFGSTRHIC